MRIRQKTNRSLRLARDRFRRALGSFEQFEEFRIGPREAGIIFIAGACMLFLAATANAARIDDRRVGPNDGAKLVHKTVERLIDRARSEWRAKDHAAVVDTLSTMIAIPALSQPARAAALLDRGNAYLQLGELSRAVLDFDASLGLSPAEPERADLLRGMAYER